MSFADADCNGDKAGKFAVEGVVGADPGLG